MPVPVWWPQVAATTRQMRRFTGMLLDLATPDWDGYTITLVFPGESAAVWRDSCSGRILTAALRHHGVHVAVNVTAAG
ncbi:hypothetical protein ACIQMV_08720 [Streptomyces sp. NPDC091412]|uniref:hypothetical protein n=1 Tax=Streptomyces sp. NPDC091412 TaxID=3366002 RepID=UPI00380E99BA